MPGTTRLRCECPACQGRRLVAPLLLIAIGALWLLHSLRGWSTESALGGLLLAWGGLELAVAMLPGPRPLPDPRTSTHRRGAWFGPLLMMAMGAVVLLHQRLPDLGALLARYWPVLLIVWGLVRLVEFYATPERTRSGLAAGDIFLLLAIILFGLLWARWYDFSTTQPWLDDLGIHLGNWNPFQNSYPFHAEATATLAPGDQVIVRSRRGDVTLLAGTGPGLTATLTDAVRADTAPAAQALFQASQPTLRHQGNTWFVDAAGERGGAQVEANLQLRLPASTPVTVESADGDLSVSGWTAPLQLTARRGDVRVDQVAGVSLNAAHGDVTVTHVSGSAEVNGGGGGDLTVSDVGGTTTLHGEFSGNVTLRRLAGPVSFESSRTRLSASALPGSASFDLDDMTVNQARGLAVETRNKSITAGDLEGPVRIADQNESVTVTLRTPPTAPVSVSTTNADVQVTLPAASSFTLDANAERGGEIHNDFGLPVERGNTARAHGPVGPNPVAPVELHTTSGTITLQKG